MGSTPLYQQIAESVRRDVLFGNLQPGDRLPSVRGMADQWHCTPGTVQRAYKELSRQGLVVSRTGQGTRVVSGIALAQEKRGAPFRQAALVHQAETFLLQVLMAGHFPEDVEQAVRLALDRWRALVHEPHSPPPHVLRFAGSHDPAIALIASRFADLGTDHALRVTFSGSLGGLIALAEREADIAGSHLWDEESDTYNEPFVRRVLPGRRVALLTVAHRRLGLITAAGNPARIAGLEDLARSGLRFINRQRGAGTRVWLDAQLRRLGISSERLSGYAEEALTHSAVASAIAENRADVALGVEAAALAYRLNFIPLTMERYDLVIPVNVWESPPIQALAGSLSTDETKAAIADLGGYDTGETGQVTWVQ